MKTAEPKIIYLQIGEDADITEFKPEDFETNAITWCWRRIFHNDIEYISKQSIIELIDEQIELTIAKKNLANTFPTNEADNKLIGKYEYHLYELSELKGKIEAL